MSQEIRISYKETEFVLNSHFNDAMIERFLFSYRLDGWKV